MENAAKARNAKTFDKFIGFGISAHTPVPNAKNQTMTAKRGQLIFFI